MRLLLLLSILIVLNACKPVSEQLEYFNPKDPRKANEQGANSTTAGTCTSFTMDTWQSFVEDQAPWYAGTVSAVAGCMLDLGDVVDKNKLQKQALINQAALKCTGKANVFEMLKCMHQQTLDLIADPENAQYLKETDCEGHSAIFKQIADKAFAQMKDAPHVSYEFFSNHVLNTVELEINGESHRYGIDVPNTPPGYIIPFEEEDACLVIPSPTPTPGEMNPIPTSGMSGGVESCRFEIASLKYVMQANGGYDPEVIYVPHCIEARDFQIPGQTPCDFYSSIAGENGLVKNVSYRLGEGCPTSNLVGICLRLHADGQKESDYFYTPSNDDSVFGGIAGTKSPQEWCTDEEGQWKTSAN